MLKFLRSNSIILIVATLVIVLLLTPIGLAIHFAPSPSEIIERDQQDMREHPGYTCGLEEEYTFNNCARICDKMGGMKQHCWDAYFLGVEEREQ